MKCTRWLVAAAMLGCSGIVAADTVRFYDTGDGTTNGGSFRAVTGTRGTFETFCIETDEYVSMGALYYYQISNVAKDGGSDNSGWDPISAVTQNIYYSFRQGGIASIIGSSNANNIADAVQNAIWWEEGEIGSLAAGYSTTLYNHFSNSGNWVAGASAVRVMNVWTNPDYTGNAQDMLIVPLPTGAGLACVGLLGLAGVRRRRG